MLVILVLAYIAFLYCSIGWVLFVSLACGVLVYRPEHREIFRHHNLEGLTLDLALGTVWPILLVPLLRGSVPVLFWFQDDN